MKKINLVLLILLLSLGLKAQDKMPPVSHYCYYKLHNYSGSRAVLYALRGSQMIPLDTARVQLNAFVFSDIHLYPVGMYRIKFDDSLFTELIFNNEDIVIEADASSIMTSMLVKRSDENRVLFDYWRYALKVRDSIAAVEFQKGKMYKSGHYSVQAAKAYDDKIDRLNDHLYDYIDKIKEEYPDLFAPVVLRSYLIPSYKRYLADKENTPYPNEKLFYLYHFFDNIDFSDARLLNTRIIYTAINDYMATFAKPAKTAVYKDIVDRVMGLAKANEAVYQYCVNLFVEAFDNTIWEDVFVYVVDNYYLKSHAYNPQQAAYYKKKVATIKSLRLGKIIPDVTLPDTSGKEISLHSVKAKAKMLLIYSSDCSHCREMMPDLQEIYDAYHPDGFEIYAIAIDDSADVWLNEIRSEGYKWISVSDLKGLMSPVLDKYNVWMTPTMFMLDSKNMIVNKPRTAADIHATLLQLLKMDR
jgi:peroxiredoxin